MDEEFVDIDPLALLELNSNSPQEPRDGKVRAVGSVWKLYFPEGTNPSEEKIAGLTGAVKAQRVQQSKNPARVTPTDGGNK